jgi:hypothetical protein
VSTIGAKVAAELCGITYRQLDNWARQGWIQANGGGSQGVPRWLDWQQRRALEAMAALVHAGVAPETAAGLVRGDEELLRQLRVALELCEQLRELA